MRCRAAILLSVAYALAVLAPHAALAFSNGPVTAHCLTEIANILHKHDFKDLSLDAGHEKLSPTQVHGDTAVHVHGEMKSAAGHFKQINHGSEKNCCGLFCISAIAWADIAPLLLPVSFAASSPTADTKLRSRSPDRLIEPPIG